jgi:CSLREA domain-containing protein
MTNPQIRICHLLLLGIATLAIPGLHAETIFTVDTLADQLDDDVSDGLCHTPTNACSLRAAIMQANHSTVPLTRINLPAGTYVLTRPPTGSDGEDSGDLNLAVPLNAGQTIDIVGAGSTSTIIDANQSGGVIYIAPNRMANISGVTIRNGYKPTSSGGGVIVYGTLAITDSTIEDNHGYLGGGILNQGTNTVSIVRCVIQHNSAHTGAGIDNEGTLNLDHSVVRSNVAEYQGGGLYVGLYAYATVRDSTFSDNNAQLGGAIYNDDNHQNRVFIVASTLSQNWASDSGGGIENAGYLYVVSSTISGGYANKNGGGIGNSYAAFLYNTTVVGNDADHDRDENGGIGGGVYNPFAQFVAVNSLIASNTIGNTPIYDDCDGIVQVYGWNLFGEIAGCTFTGNGATARGLVSLNTIGPLQDNGGPTPTHALLPGSEAIDSTYTQGCIDQNGAPLATDQRGAPRVVTAIFGNPRRCDVGAFEFGATPPVEDLIFKNGFE